MLTRIQKQKIIKDLKEKIQKQKIIIFVDFTGLKVKDLFNLRKKLKTIDSQIKVAKKTLAEIAFKELKGKTLQSFDVKNLRGQVAFIFGFKDEISPTKIVWLTSQENPNLKILGGFLEDQFIEAEKVIELAKLSGKEELLRRLVGSVSAPISNFIYILQANTKGLLYVLNAIKK
jgi:large subunit ribosomal protein L10